MKTVVWILACSISFCSCHSPRYVYSPSAQNIPLLRQQGDSKAGINYSTNINGQRTINGNNLDEWSRGMDIQTAYAITDRWAIQANYFSRSEQNEARTLFNYFDSATIRYSRSMYEIAAGYYKPSDGKMNEILQLFGGVGFGKVYFTDNGIDRNGLLYNRFFDADVAKLFFQPAFIFNANRLFTVSFSSRFSYISFRNVSTNYDSSGLADRRLNDVNTMPGLFWEPALVNSIGFRKFRGFRLEYQLGVTAMMNNAIFSFRKSNFSVGLFFDFPKLLKRNPAPKAE